MSKLTSALCCIVVIVISSCNCAPLSRTKRQVVPKEFANINIENYLKNDRAVQFQLKCIVYDGPCDRIGKYLKVTIPEILTNQCQNCEPAQRQRAGRLVSHIQQKFPKEWSDAVKKFQGGQVKKEDADKLESLLGVKLDSKLIAESPTTSAPNVPTTEASTTTTSTTPTASPASSSSPPVVSGGTGSPAPASSTSNPTSSTTSDAPLSSTVVPASSSAPPIVVSSTPEAPIVVTTTTIASVNNSSTTTEAPSSSSTSIPVVSSTVASTTTTSSTATPNSPEIVSSSTTTAPEPTKI